MFNHIAEDFLAVLAYFRGTDDSDTIAPEPADVRVEALAAQAFRFLDAQAEPVDLADEAADAIACPLAA